MLSFGTAYCARRADPCGATVIAYILSRYADSSNFSKLASVDGATGWPVLNIHSVNSYYVNLRGGICLWIASEGLTLAETKRSLMQGLTY